MFSNAIVYNLLRTAALLTIGLLIGCSDRQNTSEKTDRLKLSDGSTVVVRKSGDQLRWTRGNETGEMQIGKSDRERFYRLDPNVEDVGTWVRISLDKPGLSGHPEGTWGEDSFRGPQTRGTAILEVNELP